MLTHVAEVDVTDITAIADVPFPFAFECATGLHVRRQNDAFQREPLGISDPVGLGFPAGSCVTTGRRLMAWCARAWNMPLLTVTRHNRYMIWFRLVPKSGDTMAVSTACATVHTVMPVRVLRIQRQQISRQTVRIDSVAHARLAQLRNPEAIQVHTRAPMGRACFDNTFVDHDVHRPICLYAVEHGVNRGLPTSQIARQAVVFEEGAHVMAFAHELWEGDVAALLHNALHI
uniref:Uncharacterized protein n=1 Tax=Pseudomonas phage PaBG TaxID=1335230 RepID=S5WBM7_9CAUD